MANANRSKVTNEMADALHLKLYNLTEIVKLAAFAAEARRTLNGIDDVLHYRPEMQKVISEGVAHARNWDEMPDTASEVLHCVTRELEEVNEGFSEALYGAISQVESLTPDAA